ncbi:MAG: hypothetical protein PVS2B3_16940 [Steroidobacteraceae bacterium]
MPGGHIIRQAARVRQSRGRPARTAARSRKQPPAAPLWKHAPFGTVPGTVSETAWRLLTTLPDLPSAQSLAEILVADGVTARVMSDAGVLGQAAPSRIYVDAAHVHRARRSMAQRQFTDEELDDLATGRADSADAPE